MRHLNPVDLHISAEHPRSRLVCARQLYILFMYAL